MQAPLRPELNLKQAPALHISPYLAHSVQVLAMPALELEQYLRTQLESNPLLEEVDEIETQEQTTEEIANPELGADEDFPEEDARSLVEKESGLYEQSLPETLSAFLLFQLQTQFSDQLTLELGEEMIGSIEEDGYFTGNLEQIATANGLPLERVEAVLGAIQALEPAGVGARNPGECLLLQLNEREDVLPWTRIIVADHLEEISDKRNWRRIARAVGCSLEELRAVLTEIQSLNPYPGRSFSAGKPYYIQPDLILRDCDGSYELELNSTFIPRVRVSRSYQHLLRDPEAGQFLRKKLTEARWVVRCIERREETLKKVGTFLVKHQKTFFSKGVTCLRPLALRDVSLELGIHESTASRTIKGKYIDTPRGIFPLKMLLPAGLPRKGQPAGGYQLRAASSTGHQSLVTSEAQAKEAIRQILEAEDHRKPYSDEEISWQLEKREIFLARRTVAKYREALEYPIKARRKEQDK